jgi:broad specificity phosphatase PhoE
MTTHILKLVCFSTLALLLGCSRSITTVVLVRHADRQGDLDQLDPTLGTARANELARVLADANITAIYSTDKARTRATAEPLAKRLGIPVRTYEPDSSQLAVFAKKIKKVHRGEAMLVVGHSNTVPLTAHLLGAQPRPADLQHGDYDELFIVLVPKRGAARLLRLEYGAVTPP